MSQTHALVQTLKQILKARGMTYRDIAQGLEISEASVKRNFSGYSFTLERIDQICELAGIELVDLVKQMDAQLRSLVELTETQEQEIASDDALLLVTYLIINYWEYDEILQYYKFTEHELIQYLARLDRLKMIELLPNNRFRLLISADFSWRKNGPIQAFFTENLQKDFLNSAFAEEDESLLFLSAMLTTASRTRLQKRLEDVAHEFNELRKQDTQIPFDRRYTCSMILAIRPWKSKVFNKYLRE